MVITQRKFTVLSVETVFAEVVLTGRAYTVTAPVTEGIDQLVQQGFVSGRPALDLEGEDVSPLYQHYYRLPAGVYITAVGAESPLQEGDVITALNGLRVMGVEELEQALSRYAVGDTITVTALRNYRSVELTLTVVEAKK